MPLTDDAVLYLETCPASADIGRLSPEEFGERIAGLRDLPENIRRVLTADETTRRLQALALTEHQLSREQAQSLARLLGGILRGEESAALLPRLLEERVPVLPAVARKISAVLMKEFITPHYFQIAQLYEKKHPKTESERSVGSGRSGEPPTTGPARPPPTATGASPERVVDLRNGPLPPKLPPPPPAFPP